MYAYCFHKVHLSSERKLVKLLLIFGLKKKVILNQNSNVRALEQFLSYFFKSYNGFSGLGHMERC